MQTIIETSDKNYEYLKEHSTSVPVDKIIANITPLTSGNKTEYFVLLFDGFVEEHILCDSLDEAIHFIQKIEIPNLKLYKRTILIEEVNTEGNSIVIK